MKFIMILFVCINNPFAPIESTCVMQPLKMTFDSLEECRVAAEFIYQDIKQHDVYMSSFCAQKKLTDL